MLLNKETGPNQTYEFIKILMDCRYLLPHNIQLRESLHALLPKGAQHGAMAQTVDWDIVVSEHLLRYYVYFWTNALVKGIKPFIFTTTDKIVLLLFFYVFGIW